MGTREGTETHRLHRISNKPFGSFPFPFPTLQMSFEHLLPPSWKSQVNDWLVEDTPSFDYGGYIVGETERTAFLFGKGKQPAVLAGRPFFTEIFSQLGCQYVN